MRIRREPFGAAVAIGDGLRRAVAVAVADARDT
jgi:hypothetical protein